jgi:hypothetical protein
MCSYCHELCALQVIGKAGSNVEQLQRSSAARIQLSRSGEFYPGEKLKSILGIGVDCNVYL